MCVCVRACVCVAMVRVEIGKEDDLSPETDSDTMDVDTISHDGDEKQPKPLLGNGGVGVAKGGGFIVPEPMPEYVVSENISNIIISYEYLH